MSCKPCRDWALDAAAEIRSCFQVCRSLNVVDLRKIFIAMTRIHFSDADNFGDLKNELCDVVYEGPEDPKKKFIIDSVSRAVGGDENPTHQILVSVVGMESRKLGIGDEGEPAFEAQDLSGMTANRKDQSSIRFFCASISEDTAQLMAVSLRDFFQAQKEMMLQNMGFFEWELVSLSPGRRRDSQNPSKGFEYTLVLNVAVGYYLTVRDLGSHRLKTLNLQLNANA